MPHFRTIFTQIFRALGIPLQRNWIMVLFLSLMAVSSACIVGRPTHSNWHFALCWWLDLYFLVAFITLLPRNIGLVAKIVTYAIAYVLWSTEIFLFFRFHLCISPTVVNLLLETNSTESGEFLEGLMGSSVFWYTFFATLGLFFLNILTTAWRQIAAMPSINEMLHREEPQLNSEGRERERERGRGKTKDTATIVGYGCSIVATALLLLSLPSWLTHKEKMWNFFSNGKSEHAEAVAESEFFTPYYRAFQAIHLAKIAEHETETLLHRMQQLPNMDIASGVCPNIVVIIGESYNKRHASLYGYPLSTTPKLSARAQRGELLVFDNVVTPWNITSNAFRSFLSTHSSDEKGRWTDGILFPALFKRAGYKVAFVSNQFFHTASQGSIDFNGSFFLNDAEIDRLCFDYRNKFRSKNDGTITHLLRSFQPGAHNLYLIHLWGQHMEYAHRYPKEEAIFQHSDIQRSDLNERQRQIVAHYDNATRWNDEAVDRIFRYFAKKDAVVFYFSDHGEEVYDDDVKSYGRIHDEHPQRNVIRHEYEVPFFIWGSSAFRRRHANLFARMQQATHRPFSLDDLPHLLLGISGITATNSDKTPYYIGERDLIAPQFQPQRRLLRGHLDYDRAMGKSPTH